MTQHLLSLKRHKEMAPPLKRRVKDGIVYGLIGLCTAITVLSLVAILVYVLARGIPYINWTFLSTLYQPGLGQEGILPMMVSTLMLVAVTLVIAVPVGVLAAIYLSEYAKRGRILTVIRFATESLAGIPSILYGLFGFAMFVTVMKLRFSIFSGALTLAIMVLPVVIRTTEEALRAVPDSYREGSFALGAGKLYTITHAVLPNAIAGILTSVILSVGRIVGETAALVYTMGSSVQMPTKGLLSSGRSLSVHLFFLAKEGTSAEQSFAVAAVLMVVVAAINMLASWVARWMRAGRKDHQRRRGVRA